MRKKPGEFSIENGVEIEWVTKTEMKREMDRLDALAKKLISLTENQLADLNLAEQLLADIHLAKKIQNKHEAFRRQLQLLGKRLRNEDTDVIKASLAGLENKHIRATQLHHQLEEMRDSIIANGDDTINAVIAKHPTIDRQKVRQLAGQANKEQSQKKPPKASRELFKYLRETITE